MDGALGTVSSDILTWNSFQFYDDAFLTRGTDTLKFGFAVEHIQNSEFSGGVPPNGSYKFDTLATFLQNQPKSLLLDDPATTLPINVQQTLFGSYAHDARRYRSTL